MLVAGVIAVLVVVAVLLVIATIRAVRIVTLPVKLNFSRTCDMITH